jgi:intracellular sulfur oxidation DsrE/DsrF family protein
MHIRYLFSALFVSLLLAIAPGHAETKLADPPPSVDKPRRILLQLSSDDIKVMNGVLTNAANLQKFYGPDKVEIVIVAFGPGMDALYSKTSPVADRVSSLMHYDVKFFGCANTMEVTRHTADELISGVEVAGAGIAEIVERQLRGWVYIRP